ncbi:hypothetical protein OY671_011017, partial [Metschnikowia pulcherrima]
MMGYANSLNNWHPGSAVATVVNGKVHMNMIPIIEVEIDGRPRHVFQWNGKSYTSTDRKAAPQLTKPRNWPPKSVLEPGASHKWVPVVAFDFHEVVVSFMEQFARVANASYPGANSDASKAGFYHFGYDPE